MRNLIGSTSITKSYDFMGQKNSVKIRKLTGSQVKEFQKFVDSLKDVAADQQGTRVQNAIIRLGVVDADDMTDEELDSFPLDEVSKLAVEVLTFSGIDTNKAAEGNA